MHTFTCLRPGSRYLWRMAILIVQSSTNKTLFVDIGDLDPDVVPKALRTVSYKGYAIGVVEALRWFTSEVTDLTSLFNIFSSDFVCVVSFDDRRGVFQPRHVDLKKVQGLPHPLRHAVLQDWATHLHNMAWDNLRPELAKIETELASYVATA
jgi:hypothetical protein